MMYPFTLIKAAKKFQNRSNLDCLITSFNSFRGGDGGRIVSYLSERTFGNVEILRPGSASCEQTQNLTLLLKKESYSIQFYLKLFYIFPNQAFITFIG